MMEAKFDTYEYAIGGKMVVGRATMSEHYKLMMEDGNNDAIKKIKEDLVHQMATFMLENKLVEFAYQDNPMDYSRSIAIRAYLAPNDQIKILRSVIKV